MTRADLESMLDKRLKTTTWLEDGKDADLVIEAVLEDMSVEAGGVEKARWDCRPDTMFATNTSALPITEMASVLKDPGRMIGLFTSLIRPPASAAPRDHLCAEDFQPDSGDIGVLGASAIRKYPSSSMMRRVSVEAARRSCWRVCVFGGGRRGRKSGGKGDEGLRHAHGSR